MQNVRSNYSNSLSKKIATKQEEISDKYTRLKETKDTKEWMEISSQLASLSVDLDNLKKQFEFRSSKGEYVPDRIEIVIPKNR
jgi:hypothetical protein